MQHQRTPIAPTSLTLAALFLCLAIAGCGSGSGAAVTQNVATTAPTVSTYSGPPPATADVQNFQLEFWNNLVPNNRCGECHNENQNPRFVRADDINLAFDAANTVVNLNDPASSRIVDQVRGGHFCWLSDDDACASIITSYIESWAGNTLGASEQSINLTAPALRDPGATRNFPESSQGFATTVYPLLTQYCSGCHTAAAAVPQQPFFASPNVETAYQAAQTRIDLNTPINSRLVVRLGSEFHNCWDDCMDNAAEMEDAITQFAAGIDLTEIDPALVTSKALGLSDGILASGGGRFESNVIALYEFSTGSGSTAFDTSGVNPAIDLTLSGDTSWVGGFGISMTDGKAQGSTTASRKLTDRLSATNEYSIEAWVVPANVTQDGPARIVTYSGGGDDRNFMLGQTLYDYNYLNRTDTTGASGEPAVSTPSDEEVLQATLQHVVTVYDPTEGRRTYVNGELRSEPESEAAGLLNEWNDTYALALGSDVDNQNRWAGTIRFLAIHERALSPDQIQTNFAAGVGERFFLLFNISDHIGTSDAYVVFEVAQFDTFSYLFNSPFITVLGDEPLETFELEGLRIGINGREASVGQAFANIDLTLTGADLIAADGLLPLSELGTTIAIENGAMADEFFLTFERLGEATNVFVEADAQAPALPADAPRPPSIGVRDFAEVNASLSAITGVPTTNASVRATFEQIFQSLPTSPTIETFISSQQMAVTQLAIQYCSALVDDNSLRADFFPGFNFNADVNTAFADTSALIDPLIERGIGVVSTQPAPGAVTAELNALIGELTSCGNSCEADRTERVAKATCAAVLGSATMMVQ